MNIIIRGTSVVDGTGRPSFKADIGIQGDQITAIGDLRAQPASLVIEASELVAAPGFIDIHSHSDFSLPIAPRSESKVRQGVTTEVVGQCGHSPAPVARQYRDELIRMSGIFSGRLPWTWWSFADFLREIEDHGLGVNVVPLVGHGAIRLAVMGMSASKPTGEQMTQMQRLLSECLDEGAVGLSTGLVYAPGSYAETDELVELSRVVARRGGFYFSHIRGHGATLLDSIRETLAVAEGAELPVQVSHLKASGRENWSKFDRALELLDSATARGLDVGTDMYPYDAARTHITALLPQWVLDGGMGEAKIRLKEGPTRERIRREIVEKGIQNMEPRWEDMLVAYCPARPEIVGHDISSLAQASEVLPIDYVLDLALESEGKVGLIVFWMSEENVRKGLRHPLVSIGTDGRGLTADGPLAEGYPHPRNYGTYPRILGYYVRQEHLLSLEEAVHKMTGLPAARMRLKDRGRLAAGYKADMVLFNPATVDDMGGYAQPPAYPRGIEYVLVNGEVVVRKGEHTGQLSGRVLGWPDRQG
ncbi:MAG: N-acyl-D-amino-acid deacylase family protein [Armatimonadota bacterium]